MMLKNVPVLAFLLGDNELPGVSARRFTFEGGLMKSAGTTCPESGVTAVRFLPLGGYR